MWPFPDPLSASLRKDDCGSLTHFLCHQGGDGSRQPSNKELELAQIQGKAFYEAVSKVDFSG